MLQVYNRVLPNFKRLYSISNYYAGAGGGKGAEERDGAGEPEERGGCPAAYGWAQIVVIVASSAP